MTSACAACQNATWGSWSAWSESCTVVYPSIYTEAINTNTSIPGWAYGDFIGPGTFEVNQASANTTALPSTGTPPVTASITNTLSSSTSSPTTSATGAAGSGHKKSNAGAIAGGVVGGVVLLAIIAGVLFFLRRRRTHTAPSAQFSNYAASSQAPINSPVLMSEPFSPQPFNPSQAKFYNPDDPTTFPTTPPPGTIHTTDSSSMGPSRAAVGQYSYAPEV